MRQNDIAFVSAREGFDTTTAMGRAMLGVAAVFAQLTREMITENVEDGLTRRAEAASYRGNLRTVYGYDWYSDSRNDTINEAAAAVVRRMHGVGRRVLSGDRASETSSSAALVMGLSEGS